MPKNTVLISIDTKIATESLDFGRAFIQSLCNEDKRLIPELVANTESCKFPFRGVEEFVDEWWAVPVKTTVRGEARPDTWDGPFWRRKSSIASRGMVNHGVTDLWYHRRPSTLWFECRWARDVNFHHLFEAWLRLSHADVGMLHVFTDHELYLNDDSPARSFRTGAFGGSAKPGLPNMGWAMAYGAEYAADVDVARIKARGFSLEEIDGVTIVRVTDKLLDVVDKFDYFSRRRAELKSLFRPDLFWIAEEPID